MAARWDRLPPEANVVAPRPRRAPARGRYLCCGVRGCGAILDGTYAAAERHADTHQGARLEGYAVPDERPSP